MSRYLIRVFRQRGDRRSPYILAEEIVVSHPMICKKTGRQSTIGGVPINRMESTGRRDRRRIQIVVRRSATARGLELSRHREGVETEASAAGVKRVCRRLRDREAEEIDAIDAEIAELEERAGRTRDRRREAVRKAWRRAKFVRLAEIEERAEAETGER
jgi:hypothetical protein